MRWLWAAGLVASALAGCGEAVTEDADSPDDVTTSVDSQISGGDVATPDVPFVADTGSATDAGSEDAGTDTSDAFPPDTGPPDGGGEDVAAPSGTVQTSVQFSGGAALLVGGGRRLAISVGHPHPTARRSTEKYQLTLGSGVSTPIVSEEL